MIVVVHVRRCAFSAYLQVSWTSYSLLAGLPLPLVLQRQSEVMSDLLRLKQDISLGALHLEMLMVKKLMGKRR